MMKNGLLAFILVILCLPAMQQLLGFYDGKKLNGYFSVTNDTTFSWQQWFGGSYQQRKGNFMNDHIGFRPDLIRINNQVDFSLFETLNYGGAVLGKQHCLFYGDYINAYNGADYTGDSFIRIKMMKLKALQDTFARLNKSLLLVYCPNKAFFYPEYLPDNRKQLQGPTNYSSYLRIGDSLGINKVDFNAWFIAMKDTSRELLISKQGIHWSVYGSILAGDSLVRYVEQVRNTPIAHAVWSRVERVHGARYTDDDIAGTLNLMFAVADETFCYPILKYPTGDTGKKPKVVIIGDSFVMNLLDDGLPQHSFADWQYWQYFKFVNNKNTQQCMGCETNAQIKDTDWQKEISNTDCIILMYASINLGRDIHELGNGFIEQAYDYYYPKK
jgi:hypothetical protein